MTTLDQVATDIDVTPGILAYGVGEEDGLLIGKVIRMMTQNPRPSTLLKLQELVVDPTNSV